MKRRILSLFLALALLCALLPAAALTASAETYSGTCGANLTWTLDTNTGVLEISGTGDMEDWHNTDDIPWRPYRSGIKSVNIEYGLTSLCFGAFGYCTGMTSITLPNSVTSIGGSAFTDCTSLTSVTLPNSVTSIDWYAFSNCTGLTSVTIGARLASIGDSVFEGCTNLTSFFVSADNPNFCSVDGILCDKTMSLVLCPPGISGVFAIPDKVTSVGDEAFRDCRKLTGITIHDGVTSISSYAFYNCTGLSALTVDAGNPYYCSLDGVLYSKDKTELLLCPARKSGPVFTVPDSVVSIGDVAFRDCTGLTGFVFSDNVTNIGMSAFDNTGYYKDKSNWTGDLLYIGSFLIAANFEISGTCAIKEGTQAIAGDTFMSCFHLTGVSIPDSVRSIGDWAFEDCTGLTSITIGSGVTSIGHCAFMWCTGLTSVTLPNGLTSVGEAAFWGCTELKSITIPDSVTTIEEDAFGYYWDADTDDKAKVDGFTIYGYKGSAAQTYAAENGFTFVALGDTPVEPCQHAHAYSEHKDATCTEAGYDKTVCDDCGEVISETVLPALGHAWNGGEITTPPTDTTAGVKTFTCTRCGATKTESIAPTGGRVPGDLNGDGDVDTVDAIRLAKYLVGLAELTDEQIKAADVNGDGDVTALDGIRLAKFLVGLVETLRPEPAKAATR